MILYDGHKVGGYSSKLSRQVTSTLHQENEPKKYKRKVYVH